MFFTSLRSASWFSEVAGPDGVAGVATGVGGSDIGGGGDG